MKLSIIVPAHNEEDNIAGLISRVEEFGYPFDFELIVSADHCIDSTVDIVRGLSKRFNNLRVVENSLPPGFANALRTGFMNAQGDLVIPLMGDLCDDLNTIKEMYGKIREGYDVVCGSRYIRGGSRLGGSRVKGFFSMFAGWSLYYLLNIPTHDIANAFKMYRRKVLNSLVIESKGFEISMELPLKAYYLGFKITEVPTTWKEREKGKSSFKMFKLVPNYLRFYLWGISMRINALLKKEKKR